MICLSTLSNDFSETTRLISIKFHMQSLNRGEGGGGEESLYISSRSHDQDGHHAYIW